MSSSSWAQLFTVGVTSLVTGFCISQLLHSSRSINRETKSRSSNRASKPKAERKQQVDQVKKTGSQDPDSLSSSILTTSENATEDSYEYLEGDQGYDDEESSEEEEEVDIDSTPLNEIPGEVRMTLVVRHDLKMGKGKAAAQCSHATLALYKKITNPQSEAYNPDMVRRWEYGNGQAKITLQVPDQEEMDTLFAQAMSLGVNCSIVHDAGRTQIAAGSATVLGLGPAPKLVLDEITSHLKLY